MSKKLDVEKVDAALKRAARTAIAGSREARSGRFVHRGQVQRPTLRAAKQQEQKR